MGWESEKKTEEEKEEMTIPELILQATMEAYYKYLRDLDQVKVMLSPGAKMPTKAHADDGGFDLYAREGKVILGGGSAVFDTGVHMAIPKGYAGVLISKSGLNVVYDMTSTGLIDSGYTGSIAVKLINHGRKPYEVKKGDKISQILLVPILRARLVEVDSLDETDRGNGGFGSTGR